MNTRYTLDVLEKHLKINAVLPIHLGRVEQTKSAVVSNKVEGFDVKMVVVKLAEEISGKLV